MSGIERRLLLLTANKQRITDRLFAAMSYGPLRGVLNELCKRLLIWPLDKENEIGVELADDVSLRHLHPIRLSTILRHKRSSRP